jgi:hypothetical protein
LVEAEIALMRVESEQEDWNPRKWGEGWPVILRLRESLPLSSRLVP